MFFACFRKDLLGNILSFRYVITFALFVGLTLTATAIRTHIYKKQAADYMAAVAERGRLLAAVERFWQSRGLGITVEKAPNPLAIFSAGLENEVTRSFSLSDWKEPTTGLRKLNSPSFQGLLRLDMVLVVSVICSLLALLLSFDGISGERENGTLKLLLSGPLPRDTIILSKIAAGLFTILAPLALAWTLGLFYVLVVAKVSLSPDHLARLAWIAGLSAIYITFFFSLGTAISAWAHRSATSLAIGLFCWIAFVLAMPNLVPMVVNHFSPVPPQSKILLEKDAIDRHIHEEVEPKIREELSASGKYPDLSSMTQELHRRMRQEYNKQTERIDRYHNSRIRRQLTLNQQISRMSPAASYVFASTHFAGTGTRDFLNVLTEVDRFQQEYLAVQEQQEAKRLAEEEKRKKEQRGKKKEKLIDAYDPALWPEFRPNEIALRDALNHSWFDMALLIGQTVALFMLGFIGFLRYDPR